MKFRPLHDRVVVRRTESDEKTRGEIPEQAKPRRIEIGSGSGETATLQIEADKEAA